MLWKLAPHSSRWCGQLEHFKNMLGCVCACAEGLRWQNVASRIYALMRIMSLHQVQWSKQHFVSATCPYYLVSKGHIGEADKKIGRLPLWFLISKTKNLFPLQNTRK